MSSVSEIAFAARELTLEEQRALLGRIASQVQAEESKSVIKERVLGLGRGMWHVPDDFDDPLPDEFWLGEDAYTGKDPNDRAS